MEIVCDKQANGVKSYKLSVIKQKGMERNVQDGDSS